MRGSSYIEMNTSLNHVGLLFFGAASMFLAWMARIGLHFFYAEKQFRCKTLAFGFLYAQFFFKSPQYISLYTGVSTLRVFSLELFFRYFHLLSTWGKSGSCLLWNWYLVGCDLCSSCLVLMYVCMWLLNLSQRFWHRHNWSHMFQLMYTYWDAFITLLSDFI
jgi:hypothetical protein